MKPKDGRDGTLLVDVLLSSCCGIGWVRDHWVETASHRITLYHHNSCNLMCYVLEEGEVKDRKEEESQ